jgi:hypothetical protein
VEWSQRLRFAFRESHRRRPTELSVIGDIGAHTTTGRIYDDEMIVSLELQTEAHVQLFLEPERRHVTPDQLITEFADTRLT